VNRAAPPGLVFFYDAYPPLCGGLTSGRAFGAWTKSGVDTLARVNISKTTPHGGKNAANFEGGAF